MRRLFIFIGRAGAYGVTVIGISLVSWIGFINPWRAAYRSLPELARAGGQLEKATIQRSTGRNSHNFLRIALAGHPIAFDIRADQSEASLDTLLIQLRRNQAIEVYYEPNWEIPGLHNESNSKVYQVESAGQVIYSLTAVRQRYLNQGGWGLVFLCVVGLPILGFYFRYRSER